MNPLKLTRSGKQSINSQKLIIVFRSPVFKQVCFYVFIIKLVSLNHAKLKSSSKSFFTHNVLTPYHSYITTTAEPSSRLNRRTIYLQPISHVRQFQFIRFFFRQFPNPLNTFIKNTQASFLLMLLENLYQVFMILAGIIKHEDLFLGNDDVVLTVEE